MSEAPSNARGRVKAMAHESLGRNDPIAWFDRVYREARGQPGAVPWADLEPNPALLSWAKLSRGGESARSSWDGCGERALVVGAGLGDDAEYLSSRGCDVVAFDVSDTAVAWCKKRFPRSRVRYEVADLLAPPASYAGAFDFVFRLLILSRLQRGRVLLLFDLNQAPGAFLQHEILLFCKGRVGVRSGQQVTVALQQSGRDRTKLNIAVEPIKYRLLG